MKNKPVMYATKPKLSGKVVFRDVIESALTELFFIEHPQVPKGRHDPAALKTFVRNNRDKGVWVYYPWRSTVVHIPHKETYVRLRTARNRNLIRPDEQVKYRAATVGIAGLSVGSTALAALVATGGPEHIKLADPDILEITNLNRLRGTLLDVGVHKTDIAARAAWEVDPFLTIDTWPMGVARDTLEQFIVGAPKLSVFIDEMDAIDMKFASREVCRKNRVPVVMATDNGDSIILDVERFDLEPKRPLFHGRVTVSSKEVQHMTREKFIVLSNQIIDPIMFTMRQQESIMEIGKTLSGVAQLGTAATLAGVAVAYAVRRIVTGWSMPSGRYVMGCDASFIPGYASKVEVKKRNEHTKKFVEYFSKKE